MTFVLLKNTKEDSLKNVFIQKPIKNKTGLFKLSLYGQKKYWELIQNILFYFRKKTSYRSGITWVSKRWQNLNYPYKRQDKKQGHVINPHIHESKHWHTVWSAAEVRGHIWAQMCLYVILIPWHRHNCDELWRADICEQVLWLDTSTYTSTVLIHN